MEKSDDIFLYQQNNQSVIETVTDPSGASYTIERTTKFVVTLYSKDHRTIIVKHVCDLARAREWAAANFWQVR